MNDLYQYQNDFRVACIGKTKLVNRRHAFLNSETNETIVLL